MIISDIVKVFIGTTEIETSSVVITRGIGKGYNTCSVNGLNLVGNAGDNIKIIVNNETYLFVATQINFKEEGETTIQGKGSPYVLENQSESDILLDYTNSDILIENERGDIEVVNNLPTISFGSQAYSKSATPIGRILDMVNVVKGEAYEIDSKLVLSEIKSIDEIPTINHTFLDSEIYSYAYSSNIGKTNLLNQVLINPITDDIYSEPSIEVDYEDGIASVYFNPSLSQGYSYSFLGISPNVPSSTSKVENSQLSNETQFKTVAGIDSVEYVTLNGEPFTDYVTYAGYNIIRFNHQISGEIEVKYYTKYIKSYITKTSSFLIKYLCVKSEGTIEVDSTETLSTNCKIDIKTPLTFQDGGTVQCYKDTDVTIIFVGKKGETNINTISDDIHAGGGKLIVKYTYGDTDWSNIDFMNNITSTIEDSIQTTSGTVEYNNDLGVYLVFIPMKIKSVISVLEGDVGLLGYNYVEADNPYITFHEEDKDRNVDISMVVSLITIKIPSVELCKEVKILDAVGCGGVSSQKFTDKQEEICSIPATLTINLGEMFSLPINDIKGKVVYGDNSLGNFTVNEYGKIKVTIRDKLLYTIDCGTLQEKSTVTIDSRDVL